MITSEQLRGARGMLRWSQKELSAASGVSVPTIKRMEAGTGAVRGIHATVSAVQAVLEAAGVIFTDADETAGPGVRLREGKI